MINATTPKTNRRTNVQSLSFDVGLLLIVASLLVIGLLMVYSASWDVSMTISDSQNSIFMRQVLWVALGIIGATVMPHNLYLHSGIVQTRAYRLDLPSKREALRLATWDSTIALMLARSILMPANTDTS